MKTPKKIINSYEKSSYYVSKISCSFKKKFNINASKIIHSSEKSVGKLNFSKIIQYLVIKYGYYK